MKIWRICRAVHAAEAFSGDGARRFGGRWNARGVAMVYSSSSLSLAALELFVHLEPSQAPSDLVAVAAELPEGEPGQEFLARDLPADWWTHSALPRLRALGGAWIKACSSLALSVPSAVVRQERNVLLNPLHPRIAELKIAPPEPFLFDERMFRGGSS